MHTAGFVTYVGKVIVYVASITCVRLQKIKKSQNYQLSTSPNLLLVIVLQVQIVTIACTWL